jgi:hypothetical protein
LKTLIRLEEFIPVPREELVAEFSAGASAEAVCARTLRALADRGVEKTYISNLDPRRAARCLDALEQML